MTVINEDSINNEIANSILKELSSDPDIELTLEEIKLIIQEKRKEFSPEAQREINQQESPIEFISQLLLDDIYNFPTACLPILKKPVFYNDFGMHFIFLKNLNSEKPISLITDIETTGDTSYLEDFLLIHQLLSKPASCDRYLAKLEAALQTWVGSEDYQTLPEEIKKRKAITGRPTLLSHNNLFSLPPRHSKDHSERFKILSSFFNHWAKEHGYEMAAVTEELTREEFTNLLSETRLIKDKGVTVEHGIWTHTIQQYILHAYTEEMSPSPFNHSLTELYRYLGSDKAKIVALLDNPNDENQPWDYLFDLTPTTASDFRCPEYLISYVLKKSTQSNMTNHSNAAAYPLLAECIRRETFSFAKRKAQTEAGIVDNKIIRYPLFHEASPPSDKSESISNKKPKIEQPNNENSGILMTKKA